MHPGASQYRYLPINRQPSENGQVNFIINTTRCNYIKLEGCNTLEISVSIQNFCVMYGIWANSDVIVDSLNKPSHTPGNTIHVNAGSYYKVYHNISFVTQFYLLALKAQTKAEREMIIGPGAPRLSSDLQIKTVAHGVKRMPAYDNMLNELANKKQNPHKNLIDPNPKPKIQLKSLANPRINHDPPKTKSTKPPTKSKKSSAKVTKSVSVKKPAKPSKNEFSIDDAIARLSQQELDDVEEELSEKTVSENVDEFDEEDDADVDDIDVDVGIGDDVDDLDPEEIEEDDLEDPEEDNPEEEADFDDDDEELDNPEENEEELGDEDFEDDEEDQEEDPVDENTIEVDMSKIKSRKKKPEIVIEKIGKARGRPKKTDSSPPAKKSGQRTPAKKTGGKTPKKTGKASAAKKSGRR
jgi:hypothetical protein